MTYLVLNRPIQASLVKPSDLPIFSH